MKPLPDLRRLALVAVALALAAAAQVLLTSEGGILDGAIVYLLAAALFAWTVRDADLATISPAGGVSSPPLQEMDREVSAEGDEAPRRTPLRQMPVVIGLFLASLLLSAVALLRFDRSPDAWAWGLFVLGNTSFLAALFLWEEGPRRIRSWLASIRAGRIDRTHVVILAAILVAAAGLRFYGLGSLPFGLFYDEAVNGLDARRVVAEGLTPIYVPGRHGSLFIHAAAFAFRVLGEGTVALRAVAAAVGSLTVLAFYFLVRSLFGSRTLALLGAFLLATSRWHITFSRIAFVAVLTPLFLVLTLLFLWRGLSRRSLLEMGLAGATLGLGLHGYAASRLVPLAVGLFAVIWLVAHRREWRRGLSAFAVLSVAALLAFAPLGLFAVRSPDAFLARTQATSVFVRRDEPDLSRALTENVSAHLLMFNAEGDRNGRHNLPGEPMLDPLSGMMLVLGAALAVSRLRDPRFQLLIVTFAVMLLPGVLSLDFEAPQALRSIGAMPPAYLLLVAAAAAVLGVYRRDLAPRWRRGVLAVVAVAVAYVGVTNGYTYFVRQARNFASWNAFSTAQTIVAREMARLGSGVEFYVSNHFSGHPTLRFLAPEAGEIQVWGEGDHVPISEGGPAGAALYLDPRREPEFLRARDWYPDAEAEMVRSPFGGPPVLYRVLLSPGDLSGPQGLAARYVSVEIVEGPDDPAISRREGPIDFDWLADPPLSEPFLVRWEGTLRIPVYGSYRLALEAPGEAEIWLDSATLVSGSGRIEADVTLAQGLHPIAIEAVSGPRPLRLSWQRPDREESETVPISALYAPLVRSEGLLGQYFSNADWAGPPTLERIDPDLSIYWQQIPLPRPYTVEWSGMVLAPSDGVYEFATDSKDGSTLAVAGQTVVQNPGGGRILGTAPLQAGLHPISLRYLDETHHTFVVLYWTPPGGGSEVIPSTYLLPPRESYPPLETLLAELGIAPRPPSVPLEIEVQASWGGFDEETPFDDPRAVAVGRDSTVFVLDTALLQIGLFDSQGRLLDAWSDPKWVEPADIAIDGSGNLYLVDAGLEGVLVYDRDGNRRATWGADSGLFRPRGIGLGADELLVADTGGARLVRISLEGASLGEISIPAGLEGEAAQPTDAAVDGAGRIYVPDPENQRLHLLETTGRLIRSWPIPRSDTVRAAHLTVGPDGAVYLTDPGGGRVLRFDAEGRLLSEMSLPRSEDEELPRPVGVAVSADGTVYVADPGTRTVWVLEPTS